MTTPARRISKVIPGNPHDVTTKYVYDGDQVIVEYDDHDTQDTFVLVRKYIYGLGIDEPICMIVKGSPDQCYFYHYDGLGSIVALSNSDGTMRLR